MACRRCQGPGFLWGGWLHRPELRPCPACNGGRDPLWLAAADAPKPAPRKALSRHERMIRRLLGGTGR